MKTAKLSDLIQFEGVLMEVVGIADGKTLILAPVDKTTCSECNREHGILHILEGCPNFQKGAEKVETLTETGH